MDSVKHVLKDMFFKWKKSQNSYCSKQIRMSDLNNSSVQEESFSLPYMSTLKSNTRSPKKIRNSALELELSDIFNKTNDSQIRQKNSNTKLNKRHSLNIVNDLSKDSAYSKRNSIITSTNCLSSAVSASNLKDRNVPVMGTNALKVKLQKEKSESEIIHDLVNEKFGNVLQHFQNRSLQRQSSRLSSVETQESTVSTPFTDISGADSLDTEKNCFDFFRSSDNVCETSFCGNRYSVGSSTIFENGFDDQKFLELALGKDYNEPNNDYCKDCLSISTNDLSALVSVMSSNKQMNEPLRNSDKSNNNLKKSDILMQKISIQNEIILQISKAISFCKNNKQFTSSIQQIEAEKILLIATCQKSILTSELLKNESKVEGTSENYGSLRISDLKFSVKPHKEELGQRQFVEYFVSIITNGSSIYCTDIATEENGFINFKNTFTFDKLFSDFEISISIYCLRLPKHLEVELNKNGRKSGKYSPKNIFKFLQLKHHHKLINPKNMGSLRPSSFTFWGKYDLRTCDLPKKQFLLQSTPLSSNLQNTFSANLQTDVVLTNRVSGFLTIAAKDPKNDACLTWNRYWCLLDGHLLKYWNYPTEENIFDPISILNMKYCSNTSIDKVDRSICPRSRTLLLSIGIHNSEKSLLLSADTTDEFNMWKDQLNAVLKTLIHWHCMF